MGCGTSVEISNTVQGRSDSVQEFSDATSGLKLMTDKQVRLVRITWRCLDENLTERGIKLFFHILDESPDVQTLFPWKNIPRSVLAKNPIFRGHASRFMQAIGAVVDSLGTSEQTVLLVIYDIGHRHAATSNFDDQYFDLFAKVILRLLEEELSDKFNQEVEEAWTVVIRCMVMGFKAGFKLGLTEKNGGSTYQNNEPTDYHKPIGLF